MIYKVGGDLTFWVLQNMNENGRVALCGAISAYNDDPKTTKGIYKHYITGIKNQVLIKMKIFSPIWLYFTDNQANKNGGVPS